MSDGIIFKAAFSLGIMMVLISLIYPGANAAWSNLETTIQSPPALPTWPTFTNYANQTSSSLPEYTQLILPQSNGIGGGGYGNVTPVVGGNCTVYNYASCIANSSVQFYVSPSTGVPDIASQWLSAGFQQNVSVKMQGFTVTQAAAVQISVNLVCMAPESSTGNGLANIAFFNAYGQLFYSYNPGGYICADQFGPNYYSQFGWSQVFTLPYQADFFSNMYVMFQGGSGGTFNIAYFAVTLTIKGNGPCNASGDWWNVFTNTGCAIVQGFINLGSTILQPLMLFFSGLLWGVRVITTALVFVGSVFLFIINILTGVVLGLFVSFLYFFNLPGAPPVIQGIVDAVFVVFLLAILLAILDRVVGLFGGFVNKA